MIAQICEPSNRLRQTDGEQTGPNQQFRLKVIGFGQDGS